MKIRFNVAPMVLLIVAGFDDYAVGVEHFVLIPSPAGTPQDIRFYIKVPVGSDRHPTILITSVASSVYAIDQLVVRCGQRISPKSPQIYVVYPNRFALAEIDMLRVDGVPGPGEDRPMPESQESDGWSVQSFRWIHKYDLKRSDGSLPPWPSQ